MAARIDWRMLVASSIVMSKERASRTARRIAPKASTRALSHGRHLLYPVMSGVGVLFSTLGLDCPGGHSSRSSAVLSKMWVQDTIYVLLPDSVKICGLDLVGLSLLYDEASEVVLYGG